MVAGMLQNGLQAQYYHKDILSNKQALKEKNLLQDLKIKKVIVHSFEGNRSESEGFFCEKKITKDYRQIETYTKSYITGRSILTSSYNENGLLVQSMDSSASNIRFGISFKLPVIFSNFLFTEKTFAFAAVSFKTMYNHFFNL